MSRQERVSQAVEAMYRDLDAYIATLTPQEAVGLAGATSRGMVVIGAHALPPEQIAMSLTVQSQIVHRLLAQAAPKIGFPHPSVFAAFSELCDRLVNDVNAARASQ